jgi:hypothetical protein
LIAKLFKDKFDAESGREAEVALINFHICMIQSEVGEDGVPQTAGWRIRWVISLKTQTTTQLDVVLQTLV